MVYVFVFLGEFGYELLDWQGVVRKFAERLQTAASQAGGETKARKDKIICCSRANLYPLYEMADEFIDISAVPLFKASRASGYGAIYTPVGVGRKKIRSYGVARWLWLRLRSNLLQKWLCIQVQRYVITQSKLLHELELGWELKEGILTTDHTRCTFIFSSSTTREQGCVFGNNKQGIYDNLQVNNNLYRKITPDLTMQPAIEAKLGWSLTEPFILVQSRQRDLRTEQHSTDTIPQEQLIEILGRQVKTLLLSFDTGRWLDSHSTFATHPTCFHYACRTFPEQACLIYFARQCLFFSEGDFGSHIYVPPFLGKDVVAVAPRSVYAIGSTPLAFWNAQVFQFGGQIVPKVAEEVFASPETINQFVDELMVWQGFPDQNSWYMG